MEQDDHVVGLTDEQTYYIRTWMVMDLSIEVMWEFAQRRGLLKDEVRRLSGLKICGGDPTKWDIKYVGDAIRSNHVRSRLGKKAEEVQYVAIKELIAIRNKYFGHVRCGIAQTTYAKVVKESQKQYKTLLNTDMQKRIENITHKSFADEKAVKMWRRKLKDMEDRLNDCLQSLHGDLWMRPLENWEMQVGKELLEGVDVLKVIKEQKIDEPLKIQPESVPLILEDLFHPDVCERWEIFGKYFEVSDEEISQIQRKNKHKGVGTLSESLMCDVIVFILEHQESKLPFSKENIFQWLMECGFKEDAETFKDTFHLPGYGDSDKDPCSSGGGGMIFHPPRASKEIEEHPGVPDPDHPPPPGSYETQMQGDGEWRGQTKEYSRKYTRILDAIQLIEDKRQMSIPKSVIRGALTRIGCEKDAEAWLSDKDENVRSQTLLDAFKEGGALSYVVSQSDDFVRAIREEWETMGQA